MLADQFRISFETAATVFVTTACMYLALVVVLERNGALIVVRAGKPLAPGLLAGVHGVPADYLKAP